MTGSNGKKPQHHLSVAEIVAQAREKRYVEWRWEGLDLDTVIRPRTSEEDANLATESLRHNAAVEEYRGTADEPTMLDALRLKLRGAIPCILWPDDRAPIFDHEDLDMLVTLDSPTLMEAVNKVDEVSNFTKAQAEEAAKNSVATDERSSSSVSPDAAATPASSPIPTPSDI